MWKPLLITLPEVALNSNSAGELSLPRLIQKHTQRNVHGALLITNSVKKSSFICFFLFVQSEIHYLCYCSKAYINVMADFVRALRSLYLTEDERNVMKCICLFTPGKNLIFPYIVKIFNEENKGNPFRATFQLSSFLCIRTRNLSFERSALKRYLGH